MAHKNPRCWVCGTVTTKRIRYGHRQLQRQQMGIGECCNCECSLRDYAIQLAERDRAFVRACGQLGIMLLEYQAGVSRITGTLKLRREHTKVVRTPATVYVFAVPNDKTLADLELVAAMDQTPNARIVAKLAAIPVGYYVLVRRVDPVTTPIPPGYIYRPYETTP